MSPPTAPEALGSVVYYASFSTTLTTKVHFSYSLNSSYILYIMRTNDTLLPKYSKFVKQDQDYKIRENRDYKTSMTYCTSLSSVHLKASSIKWQLQVEVHCRYLESISDSWLHLQTQLWCLSYANHHSFISKTFTPALNSDAIKHSKKQHPQTANSLALARNHNLISISLYPLCPFCTGLYYTHTHTH